MRLRNLSMRQVREMRGSNLSTTELMEKYGIVYSTVWNILNGKSYKEEGMKIRKLGNVGRKQKIFEKDKEVIKRRYFSEDDLRYKHLADEYGVRHSTIGRIINGA